MTAAAHAAPLAAFALASLVLAATPGPGVAYIVARTLSQGPGAGLASVAGVGLGNLGNALAASLGLAALVLAVPWAFELIRWAGAAYLLTLGVQAWRAPDVATVATVGVAQPPRRILRDGLVVALLNPKTALFFVAFLPQFVDPAHSSALDSAALGALFVLIAACTDTAYVLAAHAVAATLQASPGVRRLARRASATVYVALALWAVVTGWQGGR